MRKFRQKPFFHASIGDGWGYFWTSNLVRYTCKRETKKRKLKVYFAGQEDEQMKGYVVSEGYMGYVDGEYRLFADEADYREYVED